MRFLSFRSPGFLQTKDDCMMIAHFFHIFNVRQKQEVQRKGSHDL